MASRKVSCECHKNNYCFDPTCMPKLRASRLAKADIILPFRPGKKRSHPSYEEEDSKQEPDHPGRRIIVSSSSEDDAQNKKLRLPR